MSIIIASPDSLRTQVEAATGGAATVLYDDQGYPSLMHIIPKFRYEDLGLDATFGTGVATAFLKGNSELSEIFIGQYQAQIHDGRAVSLPGRDPSTYVNYDQARDACTAKGTGWHMMSMHEWAAIALWCHAQGFIPRGNTDWGRAHDATHEMGRRQDGGTAGVNDNGAARILAGSGPASWRHDNSMGGIADLVGNVWEWQHGMKLVDGQILVTEDNSWDLAETDWTALDQYISNEADVPTLQNTAATVTDAGISTTWDTLTKASGYTESQLLQRLLISPADVSMQGRLYVNTSGERMPRRGGYWADGSYAGLGALDLTNARSYAYSIIGFRPAFAL